MRRERGEDWEEKNKVRRRIRNEERRENWEEKDKVR
jgi:hypothetical protein